MSIRLTKAGDYAVRAMIHLGSLPEGGVALKDDVALSENIPSSFMAKILRQLVKGGLLKSARGVNGGFGLSRDAAEINLLQIVEAIEGPIALTECTPDPEHCTRAHDCPASSVWFEVQRQMTTLLEKTTLEALVSAPRKNRRVVFNISN